MDGFTIWFESPLLRPIIMFVIGAMVGSFSNVVVYRRPLMKWFPEKITETPFNLSKPDSRCPKCKSKLRFYHNIPIFSWVALKGKCAFCRCEIPSRYPLVELCFAIIGTLSGLFFTNPILSIAFAATLWLFIVSFLIWHDHNKIDRNLTLAAGACLFSLSVYFI